MVVLSLLLLTSAVLHRCLGILKGGLLFLSRVEVTMLNTLDICKKADRALSVRGLHVLVQEDRQMKEPDKTELFCRLEQCVLRFKSVLSFCSFKQMLKSCFKHLEKL